MENHFRHERDGTMPYDLVFGEEAFEQVLEQPIGKAHGKVFRFFVVIRVFLLVAPVGRLLFSSCGGERLSNQQTSSHSIHFPCFKDSRNRYYAPLVCMNLI